MSPRIVIAALSVAAMIASAPSFAQQPPEKSPEALAAPQARSEGLSSPSEASKVANPDNAAPLMVERSTDQRSAGKVRAEPSARN